MLNMGARQVGQPWALSLASIEAQGLHTWQWKQGSRTTQASLPGSRHTTQGREEPLQVVRVDASCVFLGSFCSDLSGSEGPPRF